MFERPWFEFESLSLPMLRPLIGYGPDLFKYTYLLERRPHGEGRVLISNRFAHNYFLHKGVELGFLGFFATLGIFGALFLGGALQLFRRRTTGAFLEPLLIVGLLAALAGRILEQMVGVAAVSDLTLSWVLLGMYAVLPGVVRSAHSEWTPESQDESERHTDGRSTATSGLVFNGPLVLRMALVVVAIVGIGAVTWLKAVNYPWAAVKAREALEEVRTGDLQGGLVSLDRAIALAPDVPAYHNFQAAVYNLYANTDLPLEQECYSQRQIVAYEVCLARKVYTGNAQGSEQRPFDWRSRLGQAESAQALAKLELDPELADVAIRLHREVAELDPQAWWRWEALAAAHLQVGQSREALPILERSLAILGGSKMSANSLVLRGIAYRNLGWHNLALAALDAAVRLDPATASYDVYNNRGATYNDLGQYQRAIEDLDEATRLGPGRAMAYINRGNAYGNLDQMEKAVQDYDWAIRLSPELALAYENRALALAYQGKDSKALQDVWTARDLGVDVARLLAKIDEVIKER